MSIDTTVLLLDAESLPASLEEQLTKREVHVEHATNTNVGEVAPLVVPDLIVQPGEHGLDAVFDSLAQEKTPPPLVVIADRGTIRKLRAKKHGAVKALIPQDLPIAAVAHRLSTMARRSAEGRPLEMTQRRQKARTSRPPAKKAVEAPRGSQAPKPPAAQQEVKIFDPEEEARKREEQALLEAEAQERAVAAARAKKKAEATAATKRAAEKREAEIEEQARARKKRFGWKSKLEEPDKHRAQTTPRPKTPKTPENSPSEVKALDELFPTEEPTATTSHPGKKHNEAASFDEPETERDEADSYEETTQAVDVSAFAPALDAEAERNSQPPQSTNTPPKKDSVPAPARPARKSSLPPPPPSKPPKKSLATQPPNTRPSRQQTQPDVGSTEPTKPAAPQDDFGTVKKKDELSVIAPLPVNMRMELAPQKENLPAIRLALLDTDLTRADAVAAALREVGMKIHPITPDTSKTRWPLLRRFAPQGLVVDEKSMARGASEWVETFRGDLFLRHVPVILVRFSRLFDEEAGDVTLDPLLHLIEHLGREEFALLDKLGPGHQVDLWLSQVAPYRLVEMLTKEDRNTRLDCRSRDERMVWHLGPGYAGKGKLADLKTDEPKERLSPEDSLAWLLSHEDCQVAVHEHSEPLAHASESRDAEELLRETTDAVAAPSRHESVRPGTPSQAMKAPSFAATPSSASAGAVGPPSIETLSSSALLSEAGAPAEGAPIPATFRSPEDSIDIPMSRKPLLSDERKAQIQNAYATARRQAAQGYQAYRQKLASLTAPLEDRVPPAALNHAHWIVPAAVFLLVLLVIGLTSGNEQPEKVAQPSSTQAPAPTAVTKTKKTPPPVKPKPAPEKKPPKDEPEEPKEETPSPEGADLWKVAPDTSLPSCEDRLGASAPKGEDPVKSVGYWKNARRLLMVGKTGEAIENMCLAGLFDPSGPASEGLAEYYLGQRSLKEAERWIRESLKANADRRKSQELLGDIENQKGNVDESRKILFETMKLSGDETKKRALTARKLKQDAALARKGGDLPRAERELRRAVLLTPEDAVLTAELGEILLRRKAADAAALWAARALELDPNYSVAMLLSARIAEARGKKDDARRFYEMVPIGDPFHKEAQRRRSLL